MLKEKLKSKFESHYLVKAKYNSDCTCPVCQYDLMEEEEKAIDDENYRLKIGYRYEQEGMPITCCMGHFSYTISMRCIGCGNLIQLTGDQCS